MFIELNRWCRSAHLPPPPQPPLADDHIPPPLWPEFFDWLECNNVTVLHLIRASVVESFWTLQAEVTPPGTRFSVAFDF